MDSSKIRPISLNLKQIQTVDTSKHSTSSSKETNKSNQSNQLNKDSRSKDNQLNQKKSTSSQSLKQSNQVTNDKEKNNKQSPDSIKKSIHNSKKIASNQSSKNQSIKKLKVPFDVKPSNPTKSEPKYSKENQNLRLLNQVDETRKELSNSKIRKLNESKDTDRSTDRTNLKSIQTSVQLVKAPTDQAKNVINNQMFKISTNSAFKKETNDNQTSNKISNSSQTSNKSNKSTASTKQSDGSNRLIDFYLKKIPDQFNYLEGAGDSNEINSFENFNQESSNTNQNSEITVHNKDNLTNKDQSADANALSSQFLKSQKASLEIEELINFKITNENDKIKAETTIDNLMKVLIKYKRSTYTSNLVDDLNTSLKEITKSS